MDILVYKKTLVTLGATLTTVSGVCWGYLYAHKELEEQFDTRLENALSEETDKIRRFYATRYKDVDPEDVSELEGVVVDTQHISIPKEALATVEGRAEVMRELAKAIDPEVDTEVEVDDGDDEYVDPEIDVDIEKLIAERSADNPYIVSKDEYERNDALYEVFNLTFFESDGVLIDDTDTDIPDTNQVVGDENLQRFGVMSGNNNVVYVQNDRTETLYAINRSRGSASAMLYGVPEEDEILEHSSMKRRRPRREDE